MSHLHPHWHTTDDEADPVPVRSAEAVHAHGFFEQPSAQLAAVSRKPAAIAGILIVVALGAFFFRGVNDLTGQLTESGDVHITAGGLNPKNLTVSAGQQIVWINDQAEPVALQSDELCSSLIGCLNTPTMQQRDRSSFIITDDIAPGTYAYRSTTNPGISGTITVAGEGTTTTGGTTTVPVQPDEADGFDDDSQPAGEDLTAPGSGTAGEADAFDSALLEAIQKQLELDSRSGVGTPALPGNEPAETGASGIPTNPHTVGTEQRRPPSSPTSEREKEKQPAVIKHKPAKQPETGSGGVWFIMTIAVVILFWVTRKSFVDYSKQP